MEKSHYIKLSFEILWISVKCAVCIHTVDAFCVGNLASGVQGIIILLVAHECVHSQDGCEDTRFSLVNDINIQYFWTTLMGYQYINNYINIK